MSIFKPTRFPRKRDLIEEALKDLDPAIREKARELLELLDENTLKNRDKVREFLRKRGLIV
ncbi:MAG: hypothetical protein ABWW65_04935 [Thermoprotei archaeon]